MQRDDAAFAYIGHAEAADAAILSAAVDFDFVDVTSVSGSSSFDGYVRNELKWSPRLICARAEFAEAHPPTDRSNAMDGA